MELQQVAKSFIKAIKHLLIKCFIFFFPRKLSVSHRLESSLQGITAAVIPRNNRQR